DGPLFHLADLQRLGLAKAAAGTLAVPGGHLADGSPRALAPHRFAFRARVGRAVAADSPRGPGLRLSGRTSHRHRVRFPAAGGLAGAELDLGLAALSHHVGPGTGPGPSAVPVKNQLRELRAAAGWSQADLADRLGVSRQTINSIETGK